MLELIKFAFFGLPDKQKQIYEPNKKHDVGRKFIKVHLKNGEVYRIAFCGRYHKYYDFIEGPDEIFHSWMEECGKTGFANLFGIKLVPIADVEKIITEASSSWMSNIKY